MRHVDEEQRADLVGDGAEARPVDDPRIRREASDDHPGLVLAREPRDLVVIEQALGVDAVLDRLEVLAREVGLGAMGEMTAVRQAHAEDGVARLEQRVVDRGVGLRSGMGLDVGVGRAEQLLGAFDGERLGDVDELAATVIALARITLRVLVGEHGPLGLEHPRRGEVLRGNQLDVGLLALALGLERLPQVLVEISDAHAAGIHRLGSVSRCEGL